jgi:hypothetical protein
MIRLIKINLYNVIFMYRYDSNLTGNIITYNL